MAIADITNGESGLSARGKINAGFTQLNALGDAQTLNLADQAEAQAGTEAEKLMTPLLAAQAIEQLAGLSSINCPQNVTIHAPVLTLGSAPGNSVGVYGNSVSQDGSITNVPSTPDLAGVDTVSLLILTSQMSELQNAVNQILGTLRRFGIISQP